MIIAFQVTLLIVIVLGFMGVVAEKDVNLRNNLTAICIISVVAFVVSVVITK